MAAIEKMCEYGSEEYLGWEMYNAKRNLIQVNPDKRKYFRKQKATLIFFKPTNEYEYVLIVPSIQGECKGHYYNHTICKGDVLRRIKRLLGGSKYLTITKSPLTLGEHFEDKRGQQNIK